MVVVAVVMAALSQRSVTEGGRNNGADVCCQYGDRGDCSSASGGSGAGGSGAALMV